jgi:xanthine dehydrogenase accessory factor
LKLTFLDRLVAAHATRRRIALVTDLSCGRQAVFADGATEGDLELDDATVGRIHEALIHDRSTMLEMPAGALFIEIWNPPLRLAIVGAVHIAQALAPIAALAGLQVMVIDPRKGFAAQHRFRDTAVIADWPDEALAVLKPDKRTAIVTLTHDPKIDDSALQAALRSEAFYIGALGSRRTHVKRVERLIAAGFDMADVARIRGPVGLDIGAVTPGEIAVSIIAGIVAEMRNDRVRARPRP